MRNKSDIFHPGPHESDFISAARLLMIGGLVYHHLFEIPGSGHSPRLNMATYDSYLPDLLNAFFHMAFMAAVPILSIISGYLFFRRRKIDFRRQLRRRLVTVFLPSWLWTTLWLAFAYALYRVGLAQGALSWADYGFEDANLMTLLNGIIGITRHPFAFQFWFIHDLLLTLCFTPVIYFFLRRFGGWLLLMMIPAWLLVSSPPIFFSSNVPVFFTVGAWLALPGGPGIQATLERLQRYGGVLACLFIAALGIRIMSHLFGGAEAFIEDYIYLCLLRVLGVLTFAWLVNGLVRGGGAFCKLLLRFSPYSFLIFAIHFPLIEVLQIIVPSIPGYDSVPGLILSWLLIPALTIVIIIFVGGIMKKTFPAGFELLNGGRAISTG